MTGSLTERELAKLRARRLELLELIRKGAGVDKRGELARINEQLGGRR
jgi:hypothetical protein